MKLSVVMTVNNRTEDVMRAVLGSFCFPGNTAWDQMVIVLDGAPPEIRRGVERALFMTTGSEKVDLVTIDREPGWLCPSAAFNRGYAAATGDIVFSLSSDFIVKPFSLDVVRTLFSTRRDFHLHGECTHAGQNYCWYSKCSCGRVTRRRQQMTWMSPSGLGFCWATSRKALDTVGGYSLDFMDGVCYEDDDLVARLFAAGYPALYPMDVGGWHIEHKRLQTAMDDAVKRNGDVMAAKWGRADYLNWRREEAGGRQCCQWPGSIPFNVSTPDGWTSEQLENFVQEVGEASEKIFRVKHKEFYPHLYANSRDENHAAIEGRNTDG